jgi:hypothetical protein
MKNKEEIIKEIERLQLELKEIESLENEHQLYIGKYYRFDFKEPSFCKVLSIKEVKPKHVIFNVLEVFGNGIFMNCYDKNEFINEITKKEFVDQYNKTWDNLNNLI